MIKNEKQYEITKVKLQEFKDALTKICGGPYANEINHKAAIQSLKSFIEEFEEDIFKYEQRYPRQKV